MSNVGKNIRRAREALGWTQEDLASRMGYKSKSTVNKVELGINDISQSKVVKYADALGVDPAALMGWEPLPFEKEKPTEDGELSEERSNFIERVRRMPESDFQRLLKFLDLVENRE